MKSKLQYYSIISIVGILVLITSSVLVVTKYIISEHIEKQIVAKINQFQIHVESKKDKEIENIIKNCRYISSNQPFMFALENHDAEAIYSILDESNRFLFGDISLISDSSNSIITKSENLNGISSISELPARPNLIGNKSPIENIIINFWSIKEAYYLVCTVPVIKDSNSIGELSIGYLISNIFENSFSEDINFAVVNKNKVIFVKFGYDDITISDFKKTHRPIVDAILTTSIPSDLFLTKIENNEVYSKLIPFGYDLPAYILVAVSKSKEYFVLDLLIEYLLYILIVGSLIIILVFFVLNNRYSKQVKVLNDELHELNIKADTSDLKIVGTLKENESKISEISEEVNTTVLFSKTINLDDQNNENEISFLETNNNYLKIQTELIELYGGKIEYIMNSKILSSFNSNDSIDKSLQCSLAIMKLISKESDSSKHKIGIGINYGSISYRDEKSGVSGETLELAESIVNISKPGQILINNELISKTELKYSIGNAKIWKFKNLKKDIKLVVVKGEMKE